jgi:hypothetical protein
MLTRRRKYCAACTNRYVAVAAEFCCTWPAKIVKALKIVQHGALARP